MHKVKAILEYLWFAFCRHEWVRDRDEAGQLVNRCMKCGVVRDDGMTALVRWRPDYEPVEPSTVKELAIPVSPRQPSPRNAPRNWHPPSYRHPDAGQNRSAA